MKTCRKLTPHLLGQPPSASDKLRKQAESHVASCAACRADVEAFSAILEGARIGWGHEYHLSPTVRRRIALRAAAGTRRSGAFALWMAGGWLRLPGALAAAAAVLVAVVALPIALRSHTDIVRSSGGVQALQVISDGGVVRLEWKDGSRDSYKVYKSDDPRAVGSTEIHVVQGNIWTDTHPESSPVVYYRIESR